MPKMQVEKEFGRRVKTLREKQGLSVCKLAMMAGVSAGNLSRMETGHRGCGNAVTAKRIANALGKKLDDLLE